MDNGSKNNIKERQIDLASSELIRDKRSETEGNERIVEPVEELQGQQVPDPEVPEKTIKRKFTVKYKARIVREADACTETGQIGSLLRREGLYSSQLAQWRQAYQKGALAALKDNKRGRKQVKHPLQAENERLKKANVQLEKRLEQAEAIIDIQKKLSGLLGIPLASEENKGSS